MELRVDNLKEQTPEELTHLFRTLMHEVEGAFQDGLLDEKERFIKQNTPHLAHFGSLTGRLTSFSSGLAQSIIESIGPVESVVYGSSGSDMITPLSFMPSTLITFDNRLFRYDPANNTREVVSFILNEKLVRGWNDANRTGNLIGYCTDLVLSGVRSDTLRVESIEQIDSENPCTKYTITMDAPYGQVTHIAYQTTVDLIHSNMVIKDAMARIPNALGRTVILTKASQSGVTDLLAGFLPNHSVLISDRGGGIDRSSAERGYIAKRWTNTTLRPLSDQNRIYTDLRRLHSAWNPKGIVVPLGFGYCNNIADIDIAEIINNQNG